ncbi:MAG TPA: phosphotransferase [Chloroflexota bacterium]|nr:phosphotransferase [Chloroflexota bacterium]
MKDFEVLSQGGQFRRLRRVAVAALAHYDLGARSPGAVHLYPLTNIENATFRVEVVNPAVASVASPLLGRAQGGESRRRYLLRIHRPNAKPAAAIRSEMQWLEALRRDTALSVPQPVRTVSGAYLTTVTAAGVPGARCCVLLRWVEGRLCSPSRVSRRLMEGLGALAGALHRHSERFEPPPGFSRPRADPEACEALGASLLELVRRARPARPAYSRLQRLVPLVTDRAAASMRFLGQDRPTFGITHGDLHLANVVLHQGEVRAIDFDDCAWGYYLQELAVVLETLQQRADFEVLRAALLAGYRRVRPLGAELESHLPTFVAARGVALLEWLVTNENQPSFRPWAGAEIARITGALETFVQRHACSVT